MPDRTNLFGVHNGSRYTIADISAQITASWGGNADFEMCWEDAVPPNRDCILDPIERFTTPIPAIGGFISVNIGHPPKPAVMIPDAYPTAPKGKFYPAMTWTLVDDETAEHGCALKRDYGLNSTVDLPTS
jgi:hypothetical protein